MESSTLLPAILDVEDEIIAIRRDLHAHPELAFQEHRTAGIVTERLRHLGLEVQTGVAQTGVVGLLRGTRPGKTIAIRADMDAIEGQEALDKPYASQVPGVQHGCGHDAHVAMALGTATILAGLRDQLQGNVKFIFEPAEEILTEGDLVTGAQLLVEQGVLKDPQVDALLYLHVWPYCPINSLELKRGVVFSGWDMLRISILGREYHGSAPEQGVDAITVAALVVSALQTLVTRTVSITEPCSIHIGSIQGGRACNLVADRVDMTGSVRAVDLALRQSLAHRIEQVVSSLAQAYGADYEINYMEYLRPVINEPELVDLVAAAVSSGPIQVVGREHPRMVGDSFHHYSEQVPAVYGLLGSGNPALKTDYPSHHPLFDIDESCMKWGVFTYCASVLRFLASQ